MRVCASLDRHSWPPTAESIVGPQRRAQPLPLFPFADADSAAFFVIISPPGRSRARRDAPQTDVRGRREASSQPRRCVWTNDNAERGRGRELAVREYCQRSGPTQTAINIPKQLQAPIPPPDHSNHLLPGNHILLRPMQTTLKVSCLHFARYCVQTLKQHILNPRSWL